MEEPLHIIYLLAANYARGGIRVQIEQANALLKRGHNVEILSPFKAPDWIEVSVPWKRIQIEEKQILGSKVPTSDLTIFSYYEQAFAIYDSLEKLNSLPVYLAQGDELLLGDPDSGNSETRDSVLSAQASLTIPYPIITVSSYTKKIFESYGASQVRIIPNGINQELFTPVEKRNNSPLRVLSVGAEKPDFKGIDLIYAALIKLQNDPDCPDFQFVRASPKENFYQQLPIDVEFHQNPSQPELARLYAEADVFVGASSLESFYLLPLEAMASGTAVICSDLPAIRDYAKPERDYLPFPPGDLPALYAKLKFALRSAATRNQLRQNGLKVARNMSWKDIALKLENEFEDILKNREAWLKKLLDHKRSGKLKYRFKQRPRN
jgi:glycosyltransferase involved in cell wall biosynthesis